MFVRNKARRQRNEFAEQLPENLDVLASALRAGHSLAGAMSVVAEEAPEPSKREFSRVVTDEQLGIPLDEALEVTAKRMQNVDMDQVAVLALVQREAGGNMAEVLDQVIANIRARMDLRRMVTVLTAQGKFSSWIVAAVPVGLFLFILVVNPDHLDPLFNRTIGQVAAIRRSGHGHRRVLHHPQDRRDRALIMLIFVLIIGLFFLAVGVTMLARAVGSARRALDRDARPDRRVRLRRPLPRRRTIASARSSASGWARSRARSAGTSSSGSAIQEARLPRAAISAGMYNVSPERLLGMQALGAIGGAFAWLLLGAARRRRGVARRVGLRRRRRHRLDGSRDLSSIGAREAPRADRAGPA